jgi:cytochrome c oxidase subunit 2
MDANEINQGEQPRQSMNPIMIGVIVVGVLLVGGFALFANKGSNSSTKTSITEIPTTTTKPSTTKAPVSTTTQNDVKEFTMTAKKFDFTPATITVSEGDRVKLTITATDVSHGFSIDELGIKQDIEVGKPTTVEFVASKRGTFRFYCSLFCGQGHKEMEGKLIVE